MGHGLSLKGRRRGRAGWLALRRENRRGALGQATVQAGLGLGRDKAGGPAIIILKRRYFEVL
ncbi:hypothetical protein E2562_037749 [Oryza meyeriana var. granulata]|uniref:Uncharacterized protein n=1 Tax=Oryza meyeriana var. granulata TaxID=110450 RepID=A0A6G1FGD5_9ORYZ|nr:hypothetical protein E2562_037749 [Oryza meyeriana var. granulata]